MGEKNRTGPRQGGRRIVDAEGSEVKPASKPASKPKPTKPKSTPPAEPTDNEGE